ncbi:hypothetical protein EON77_20260, partial [bacterium]
MRDREVCVDCRRLSPETETNYTLISAQFGWRLSRTRLPDGTIDVAWRCPSCWTTHKARRRAIEAARPTPSLSVP